MSVSLLVRLVLTRQEKLLLSGSTTSKSGSDLVVLEGFDQQFHACLRRVVKVFVMEVHEGVELLSVYHELGCPIFFSSRGATVLPRAASRRKAPMRSSLRGMMLSSVLNSATTWRQRSCTFGTRKGIIA